MPTGTVISAIVAIVFVFAVTFRMDVIMGMLRRYLVYGRKDVLLQIYKLWVYRVSKERIDKSVPLSTLLLACIGEEYDTELSPCDVGMACKAWLETLDYLTVYTVEDRMYIEQKLVKYLRSLGR